MEPDDTEEVKIICKGTEKGEGKLMEHGRLAKYRKFGFRELLFQNGKGKQLGNMQKLKGNPSVHMPGQVHGRVIPESERDNKVQYSTGTRRIYKDRVQILTKIICGSRKSCLQYSCTYKRLRQSGQQGTMRGAC